VCEFLFPIRGLESSAARPGDFADRFEKARLSRHQSGDFLFVSVIPLLFISRLSRVTKL
jgi:hypothetical protein